MSTATSTRRELPPSTRSNASVSMSWSPRKSRRFHFLSRPPEECNEAHLDNHRGERRPRQTSSGTSLYSASRRRHRSTTILANSSTRTERFCSASTPGAPTSTPSLMSPDRATPGNGLLLFFRVDDLEPPALQRARGLVPRLEEEPHLNPNTRTKEFAVRISTDTTSPSARFQGSSGPRVAPQRRICDDRRKMAGGARRV